MADLTRIIELLPCSHTLVLRDEYDEEAGPPGERVTLHRWRYDCTQCGMTVVKDVVPDA